MNLLIVTEEKEKNVSDRAAQLYKFDARKYQSLKKEGLTFDL